MALIQATALPCRASDRDLITPSPFAGPVISLDPISVRIGDEGGATDQAFDLEPQVGVTARVGRIGAFRDDAFERRLAGQLVERASVPDLVIAMVKG
jgi:hypothetical protein